MLRIERKMKVRSSHQSHHAGINLFSFQELSSRQTALANECEYVHMNHVSLNRVAVWMCVWLLWCPSILQEIRHISALHHRPTRGSSMVQTNISMTQVAVGVYCTWSTAQPSTPKPVPTQACKFTWVPGSESESTAADPEATDRSHF